MGLYIYEKSRILQEILVTKNKIVLEEGQE